MTRDPAVLAHGIVDTDRHVDGRRRQWRAEGGGQMRVWVEAVEEGRPERWGLAATLEEQ